MREEVLRRWGPSFIGFFVIKTIISCIFLQNFGAEKYILSSQEINLKFEFTMFLNLNTPSINETVVKKLLRNLR